MTPITPVLKTISEFNFNTYTHFSVDNYYLINLPLIPEPDTEQYTNLLSHEFQPLKERIEGTITSERGNQNFNYN